ncbi:MAG TPA: ABC transporter permease [Gemmatimonadales bacterium]|nr:ABC transporter permease [Gemmatimonadales bacterium]
MTAGRRVGPVLWEVGVLAAVGVLLAFLGLPLVSLLVRVPPAELWARLATRASLTALRLSLETSVCATLAVAGLGLPAAYVLATKRFRGKRVLEVLVELPMVLPPTVAGVGLLLAFGRAGLAGRALGAVGLSIPFTTLAVVLAQVFVACPFFISAATAGLREVESRYADAAATLRATPGYAFRRVLMPLALPSLVAGGAMSWARALGEFGATIMFAGNLPGRTQTLPLAVYIGLQTDLQSAVALSVILLVLSFTVLLGLRLARRPPRVPWVGRAPGDAR